MTLQGKAVEKIQIRCKPCGKRLFDLAVDRPAEGVIKIVCPRCKNILVFDLAVFNKRPADKQAV